MNDLKRLERKVRRLERELASSLTQLPHLRQMVEYTGDMLILLNSEGQIVEYNQRLSTALNIPRNALYQVPLQHILDEKDAQTTLLLETLANLAEADTARLRVNFIRLDKAPISVEVNAHCVLSDGARIIVLSARDRTVDQAREAAYEKARLKVAELRNELAQQQATEQESRVKALGLLAGSLAHDLNNVLTVMSANAQMLGMELSEPEHLELVNEFVESISRAHDLSNRFLTFSKGGSVLRRPIDLVSWLRPLVRSLTQTYRMHCHLDMDEELPKVAIDEAQVTQVITNLVVNAREACHDQAEPTLWIGCHHAYRERGPDGQRGGPYVVLSVRDNGAGIASEVLPHVFDPFFTTKSGGSGLGLAGAYRILSAHKGWIEVRTELGQGSCFDLLIPMTSGKVQTVTGSFAALPPGEALVLIVDDDLRVRQVFKRLLARLGAEFAEADGPESALRLYQGLLSKGTPPCITILDINLAGGQSGIDLLAQLRVLDPSMRAIACSGYSDTAVRDNFATVGFVDYLQKPFTIQQLHDALERAMHPRANTVTDQDAGITIG